MRNAEDSSLISDNSGLRAIRVGLCARRALNEFIEQMARDAETYTQPQEQDTWQQQQPYEPLTPEQAQQYTTDKLLRTLSEATRQPEAETPYQRQQRLDDLLTNMRDEDAAISQRENDYYSERTKRLMGEGVQIDHGEAPDFDDVAHDEQGPGLDIPVRGTTRTNPDAKPAGFCEGCAGGFEQMPTSGAQGQTVDGAKRGRRQATRAGDVEQVNTPTSQPKPKQKYCACKSGDQLEFTGIMCMDTADGFSYYEKGFYPISGTCVAEVWK